MLQKVNYCISPIIFYEVWDCREEWDGQGMQHILERGEVVQGFGGET